MAPVHRELAERLLTDILLQRLGSRQGSLERDRRLGTRHDLRQLLHRRDCRTSPDALGCGCRTGGCLANPIKRLRDFLGGIASVFTWGLPG